LGRIQGAWHPGELRRGRFDKQQQKMSINWLELYTVLILCRWFGPEWRGKRDLVWVDNTTAISYANRGHGRVEALSKLARRIRALEARHGVHLQCAHIPGVENVLSDRLSRFAQAASTQDWRLNDAEFARWSSVFGPFDADMCCDPEGHNAHVPRFYSVLDSALSQDVRHLNSWWNPPWSLLGPVFKHVLKHCQLAPATTSATIVAPGWVRDRFSAILRHYDVIHEYPAGSQLFTCRPTWAQRPGARRVNVGPTQWPVLILRPRACR
jgi:hypothetical protein